jgi:hypothetical protein
MEEDRLAGREKARVKKITRVGRYEIWWEALPFINTSLNNQPVLVLISICNKGLSKKK